MTRGEAPSKATDDVIAALEAWQSGPTGSRVPLRVLEVLDRSTSGQPYLAVTFAHHGYLAAWEIQRIAKEFLKHLAASRPDLGGPHAGFYLARPDLFPAIPEGTLEHAREFAQAWLDRIPATHAIAIPGAERPMIDEIRVCSYAYAVRAELTLDPKRIAALLERQYQQAHPERAALVRFVGCENDAQETLPARTARTGPSAAEQLAAKLGPPPSPPAYADELHAFASKFARSAYVDEQHAFASKFARAWLSLFPAEHAIYIDGARDDELDEGRVVVHVVRDDEYLLLRLCEDEVAEAIRRCYREAFPELALGVEWFAEYCK
jgi:hypothetical protein